MAHDPASPRDAPGELLAVLRGWSHEVRLAQRGTWFPLLAFAGVTLAAIPVYRFGPRHTGTCRQGADGATVCTTVAPALLVYWPIALVLAYAATAGFYLHRARRLGVGSRIRPYVVLGTVLALAAAGAAWWRAAHPPIAPSPDQLGTTSLHPGLIDAVSPLVTIGVALLVLAWVEVNRSLLVYSACYLAVVVVQSTRVIHSMSAWWFLPHLLVAAGVLLLGSAGFAALQWTRSPRRR